MHSDTAIARQSDDFFISEGVPEPWCRLHDCLHIGEDFSTGARRCGEFIRAVEDRFPVNDLFVKLLDPAVPAKWLEFILFCLLDTSTPHIQVAKQVFRLKCLRRLLMRHTTGQQLSEAETAIVASLASATHINHVDDLMAFAFRARDFVSSLGKNLDPGTRHRQVLVQVIRAEVEALAERIRKISDEIDVYNLKEMARILPRMRTFDENARAARAAAQSIADSH